MNLTINSGKQTRAIKTVIYGTEGVGKSTLASQFPSPLFIDVEGGTDQMDVRRIETPKTWTDLVAIVNEVAKNPGICETLILDTADWAESMCVSHILKKYNQKSIESFGYGKGYTMLGEEWMNLMGAFDAVKDAGMHVTIIAHAKQRKIELPDQAGAFDHWEMKVSKQVAPLLKEWADILLFLNYKTFVVTTESNSHKAQGGKRVMFTSHNPVYDAKNRHGLPDELPLSFEPIAFIYTGQQKEQKEKQLTPHEHLAELMAEAGIEEYELRDFIVSRGKQSAETPVSEYPEEFVKGYCLKYWAKIESSIKEMKENEK